MIFTIAATLAFLWFPGEPRETLGTFCPAQPLRAPRPPNYIYYIFFIYFLFNLPSSTQGFPTSTATPRPGSADSLAYDSHGGLGVLTREPSSLAEQLRGETNQQEEPKPMDLSFSAAPRRVHIPPLV